jgi:NADH-quinone oxidoreductase subunit N
MTAAELSYILPLVILAAGAIVGILALAVRRSHVVVFVLTLCTLVLSLAALRIPWVAGRESVTPLIWFDGYAVWFAGLLLAAAIAVAVMSYGYMRGRDVVREEFYILILTAALGGVVLVSSSHFASFFLALELLSASLYVLIAYDRSHPVDAEAGIKYLIPAATSSSFLLFGIAIVYTHTGTMALPVLADRLPTTWEPGHLLLFLGAAMILIGIAFKLALVPFHFWAADVYQGAPAPVTAFIATVSKGAVFALLLRYFGVMHMRTEGPFFIIFTSAAILTMFAGNFLALQQRDIKRLLAYSSIAHMGYLLVAFLASGALAVAAVSFYLLAYLVTTLGAFAVITALSGKEEDLSRIEDYRGLVLRRPVLATILAVMMFSLAGIPLTAGFLGKFYLVLAGVRSNLWLLVFVLVVNSVIGLFYYLRVIIALYEPVPPTAEQTTGVCVQASAPSGSFIGGILLAALLLSLIWIGVYPGPIIRLIESLTGSQS